MDSGQAEYLYGRLLEADLTNHDEDTTYRISGNVLSMSDRMGRSFTVPLNGPDAPYAGDPSFDRVAVKLIDSRTLEESDSKDGKVAKVTRWSIDPNGTTIHARFDDLRAMMKDILAKDPSNSRTIADKQRENDLWQKLLSQRQAAAEKKAPK